MSSKVRLLGESDFVSMLTEKMRNRSIGPWKPGSVHTLAVRTHPYMREPDAGAGYLACRTR